ncbi:MAG TPA: FKBP-type peptidyl-prolyl cis-trans isomerase [Mucilaginibacter sp.]|jgi:FKBP-type peptidyl-prolyl cis-trans isomerase|nr:FKBP-type peptidyl-prolyl cis-trans isomerase [Mucilaginibacter sp.]
MKKNLMFLALATIGLASCNSGYKQAPGGMLYNIRVDKGGPKIKTGDFMAVNVVAKTDADSVLFSSYQQGQPTFQIVPKGNPGDVMSVFPYLAEGDSVTVKTNMDSIFKKGTRRPPIKGKYIVYEIKVEKVIAKGTGKGADTVWNAQIKKYYDGQVALMKKAEGVKFKKYIDDNKLVGVTTPDGLFYTITKPGTGDKPNVGDTVEVFYVGKFTTGKIFETNVKEIAQKNNNYNPGLEYKATKVPVGVKHVIPGWDEGLMQLNKGAKATLVIPSKLAYGDRGYGAAIPPFAPLVFDIEVVNITHPNPNAPKPAPPALQPTVQIKPVGPAKK